MMGVGVPQSYNDFSMAFARTYVSKMNVNIVKLGEGGTSEVCVIISVTHLPYSLLRVTRLPRTVPPP